MKRYRKRKKAKVWHFTSRNWEVEPGDLMVHMQGDLFRLEESSGWGKRCAGELYPRKIKPPPGYDRATIKDGEVYWTREQDTDEFKCGFCCERPNFAGETEQVLDQMEAAGWIDRGPASVSRHIHGWVCPDCVANEKEFEDPSIGILV